MEATLEDIANASSVSIKTATNVNLASPTISGVGNEPAIVGAMSTASRRKSYCWFRRCKRSFCY